jgi:lincosamide nucleotidyltransferase A/C/D/E
VTASLQAHLKSLWRHGRPPRHAIESVRRRIRETSPTSSTGLILRPFWSRFGGGETDARELVAVVGALRSAGVEFWVVGGWGVDALEGQQTRKHYDVDVLLADYRGEATVAVQALAELGYRSVRTGNDPAVLLAPRNVLRDDCRHQVELLGLNRLLLDERLDPEDPRPTPVELRRPELFSTGSIDACAIPCISVELQRLLREGYPQRGIDVHDVSLLDAAVGEFDGTSGR